MYELSQSPLTCLVHGNNRLALVVSIPILMSRRFISWPLQTPLQSPWVIPYMMGGTRRRPIQNLLYLLLDLSRKLSHNPGIHFNAHPPTYTIDQDLIRVHLWWWTASPLILIFSQQQFCQPIMTRMLEVHVHVVLKQHPTSAKNVFSPGCCIISTHIHHPFHHIREWCGMYFKCTSLFALGAVLCLGQQEV